MNKTNKMAVIAEDVKKVEKKIKFSKICGDLWKLVNNFERKFISVGDSLEKINPFLMCLESVGDITNIDFIDCNEDTEDEFQNLIDEIKSVFSFICPHHLGCFEGFWAKIEKISFYLEETNEKISKSIWLNHMEEI